MNKSSVGADALKRFLDQEKANFKIKLVFLVSE